jgi:hypothetical protein
VQIAAQAKASLVKEHHGVPQLEMDRTVTTVLDIWWEWQEGRAGEALGPRIEQDVLVGLAADRQECV